MGINMRKSWIVALMYALASVPAVAQTPAPPPAASELVPLRGQMLFDANGKRLEAIYRVNSDGSVAIILDGKIRTIPAATLSMKGDKLTTSLTKSDIVGGK
jgi:hypothetical protein